MIIHNTPVINTIASFRGLIILFGILSFTSCKNKALFQLEQEPDLGSAGIYRTGATESSATPYRHLIKVDDLLGVKFLNNLDYTQPEAESISTSKKEVSYLVAYDSTVTLPLIGRVNLVGITRLEAAKKLEKLYQKHFAFPIIEVSIQNLSVNVLGEVKKPGTYPLIKESTNLVEILATAGGLTDFSKKHVVKIIRGDYSNPEIIIIDLTKVKSLAYNDLILHDKDVIYVEPINVKAPSSVMLAISPYVAVINTVVNAIILLRVFR